MKKKYLGLCAAVQMASIVPALRYKSSFRFAALRAFHFNPAAGGVLNRI
jgi:hypothetical protein